MAFRACFSCLIVSTFLAENITLALKINNLRTQALRSSYLNRQVTTSRLIAARSEIGISPYSTAVMNKLPEKREDAVRAKSTELITVSSAGTGFLYTMFIMRAVAAIERVDQIRSGLRFLALVPLVFLLSLDCMGLITVIIQPPNYKRYIKPIVSLNYVKEMMELVGRIVLFGFKFIMKRTTTAAPEISSAFNLLNIFFFTLSHQFLKAYWV